MTKEEKIQELLTVEKVGLDGLKELSALFAKRAEAAAEAEAARSAERTRQLEDIKEYLGL